MKLNWLLQRERLVTFTLALFTALLLAGDGLVAWTFIEQHNDARVRRHELCVQVELLKTGFRQDAIDNYKHLDRNGKLLNIKITPQLRKAAKESLNATLKRYAPDPC